MNTKDHDRVGQGTKCEVKQLYNHSAEGTPLWSDFDDPAKEEQRLQAAGLRSAIIQRFCKKKDAGEDGQPGPWQTQSLEIQSPRLRKFLDEAFAGHPDWSSGPTPFTFTPPFRGLFHVWGKILDGSGSKQTEYPIRVEVALLREALKSSLAPYFSELEHIKEAKTIGFKSVWLLFPPGTLVVTDMGGHICVSKLQAITFEVKKEGFFDSHPDRWCLDLIRYDWNGSYCGFRTGVAYIDDFTGSHSVTMLSAYPFEFLEDEAGTRKRLIDRGRKFLSLRGFSVKNCTGSKFVIEKGFFQDKEVVKPVSGRVIVDAYAYYKCQSQMAPRLSRDREGATPAEPPENEQTQTLPGRKERKEELFPLSDAELLLCIPRVKGFDLKTKEWAEFNVDDIQDPEWNETAYEKLVLREGEKELVAAFADRAKSRAQKFDDFISNKGEGIIILLCGPPGVGKTLTAEAAAEKSNVPLYVLGAGELGTTPNEVETALDRALECCRLWDAVLLLDEGDVFLEDRSSGSANQNGLVSVFLRRLEYYQGLMFLTTNRIKAIDPAFRSRADLILPYPSLNATARREIWSNFLGRLAPGTFQFSDDELGELAQNDLNGREIKNMIKTAQILSTPDGVLTMKHLRVVLDIRKRCYDAEDAEVEEPTIKRQKI
ncbi:hypothetical protein TWF481_008326 [Arthrobotrys musiformis]|uniref:AAA+ ATPase domain-containing protein n=1 Tax=Arthrobotrys musiformis TaxID=47236 RepID=A0AAV9W6T6_9PEZI